MGEEYQGTVPEPSYSVASSSCISVVNGLRLRKYPSWLAYLTALTTLGSGVYSSMAFKWMNRNQAVPCAGCPKKDFEGALLQTILMFIGEALCYVIYCADSAISSSRGRANLFDFVTDHREYKHKSECKWWYWALCALLDMVSSLMINVATLLTYASTVAMLRNLMVVGTAVTQLLTIRKALKVHEWIGAGLITVAMALSAIPSLQTPESTKYSNAKVTLGICLCLLGTVIQSIQLLGEEICFRKGRYPPLKAVGIEGISGLIYSFVSWYPYHASGAENVNQSWYMLFHSNFHLIVAIVFILGAIVFNAAGLATTKLAGGLLRGIIFACRSPLVWIVSLIVKWQDYENWNLASTLLFFVGFMSYINRTLIFDKSEWIRKPVHCCCTDPALDDEIQPGYRKETDAELAEALAEQQRELEHRPEV